MGELKLGTLRLIDDAIMARSKKEKSRQYMGGSILGTECDRQLWYDYKNPEPVNDPRVQRIFDFGNLIEDYVINLLRDAGITVYDKDANGEQFGFVDDEIAGHSDGVLVGLPESKEPHLFECKSASDKNFNLFVKDGLAKTNKKYLTQVHVYMRKLGLENCLFVVMNKNTCELYLERVKLDKFIADHAITRGKEIARMENEPDRKYKDSTFYKCKFCNHRERCWNENNK